MRGRSRADDTREGSGLDRPAFETLYERAFGRVWAHAAREAGGDRRRAERLTRAILERAFRDGLDAAGCDDFERRLFEAALAVRAARPRRAGPGSSEARRSERSALSAAAAHAGPAPPGP
jgi:uncharacterized protein (DUF2267 family)